MNIEKINTLILNTTEKPIKFSDFSGKYLVIYFYPKDNTPGCTTEGIDFKFYNADFLMINTQIFGVSRDSVASHCKFRDKHDFPFILISDVDEKLCEFFDVIKEKSLYGKKYLGIERSTFVFDTKGELIKEWRGVKVKDHAKTVLQFIKDYQN